jgi:V-type H+-transporting ATPase subunit D
LIDINSELDELDREEFYRLKVSNKKQRDQAAADAALLKKQRVGSDKENEAAALRSTLGAGSQPASQKED